eukprot:2799471-Pyramimonas_sp.AAC.1
MLASEGLCAGLKEFMGKLSSLPPKYHRCVSSTVEQINSQYLESELTKKSEQGDKRDTKAFIQTVLTEVTVVLDALLPRKWIDACMSAAALCRERASKGIPKPLDDVFGDESAMESFLKLRAIYTLQVLVKTVGDPEGLGDAETSQALSYMQGKQERIDDLASLDVQTAGPKRTAMWLHMIEVAQIVANITDDTVAQKRWASNVDTVLLTVKPDTGASAGKGHAEKSGATTSDNSEGQKEPKEPATPKLTTVVQSVRDQLASGAEHKDEAARAEVERLAAGADDDDVDQNSHWGLRQTFFADAHRSTGWPQILPEA